MSSRTASLATLLIPVAVLLAGFFAYGFRSVDYFAALPGDLGDARFNSVVLEHGYRWVRGLEPSLWSPRFFYPFEGVLALSDNLLGSAPVYLIFRGAGLDREAAFGAWYLVGVALNFVAAWVCIRRLGSSAVGAAAGAFVYAFALPALAQESHAQLNYRFSLPLAYSAFQQWLWARDTAAVGRVAFWGVLQFFCSIYLGVFLSFLLVATLLAEWIRRRVASPAPGVAGAADVADAARGGRRRAGPLPLAVASVSLLALLLLLGIYQRASADYQLASRGEGIAILPQLASYFIADRTPIGSWIGGGIGDVDARHEHQLFLGVAAWLLVVLGAATAWRRHLRVGQSATLTLAILMVATLSVGGASLYLAAAYLPGLTAIRSVPRVVLVMLLPASILAALGADRIAELARRLPPVVATPVVTLMFAALFAETASYRPYRTPRSAWAERQRVLRAQLPAELGADAILIAREQAGDPPFAAELDAMILAQDLGVATLNGYAGRRPPGVSPPNNCDAAEARIVAYARHRSLADGATDALRRRVVKLGFSGCD